MNTIKEALLNKAATAANKIAQQEAKFWPPFCLGPLFQPERPMTSEQNKDNTNV